MLTKDLSKINLNDLPLEEVAYGNALDSFITLKVYNELIVKLREVELEDFYNNIIVPALEVFLDLEYQGAPIDKENLLSLKDKLGSKLKEMRSALENHPQVKGQNINSNDVLKGIFYENPDGYKIYPPKRTKGTNAPSTDRKALKFIQVAIKNELEKRK